MEQKSPLITKKIWKLVHMMFFMLKKGIAKRKFLADLNMIMKRGKITGYKALQNLTFHHNDNAQSGDYEFSCRDTPPYPLSLFSNHNKHQNKHDRLSTNNPPLAIDDCNDMVINSAVLNVLDHMLTNGAQSRITDSPYPVTKGLFGSKNLKEFDEKKFSGHEDGLVDEAAEMFIKRFYNDRIREN